ncbi:hypothetical protein BGZ51_007048 [Haplosporangium sp. Z 767]|nr:hypothetical protein BGZ50_002665 [Haplosporangium sp. Z 11]KAF9194828.1 hypothetical protein BGZ51_007048 [Haplosporangium sp. Z 767]
MTLFHQHTGQLRAWARRTLWCVVVIGSLCAVVLPIFMIYRKEGDNARSVVEVGPQGVSHTGDYIHVVGSVASVDFEDKNFRVHFEFTPHGTLAGDDGILVAPIALSLFYTTLTFPVAQIMRSVDVTMPYMQGATIDYPFDAYKSYFEILANKEKEQLRKIPVSLTFLGMLQSVEFIPTVHLSNDDLYKISIEIFTRRSPTTIGFSIFIVMIMWALSIAIGIIAIQVVRKHRASDEHILTLGITTLFALPALRETQPGIPAIGCAADVLGFYWNMAIIAISSIMIVMASALRWKEPSIKEELELVQKQHDFQSKLIKEMTIPMPLPITGGPFYNYQVKKKRMPFLGGFRHGHHGLHGLHPNDNCHSVHQAPLQSLGRGRHSLHECTYGDLNLETETQRKECENCHYEEKDHHQDHYEDQQQQQHRKRQQKRFDIDGEDREEHIQQHNGLVQTLSEISPTRPNAPGTQYRRAFPYINSTNDNSTTHHNSRSNSNRTNNNNNSGNNSGNNTININSTRSSNNNSRTSTFGIRHATSHWSIIHKPRKSTIPSNRISRINSNNSKSDDGIDYKRRDEPSHTYRSLPDALLFLSLESSTTVPGLGERTVSRDDNGQIGD